MGRPPRLLTTLWVPAVRSGSGVNTREKALLASQRTSQEPGIQLDIEPESASQHIRRMSRTSPEVVKSLVQCFAYSNIWRAHVPELGDGLVKEHYI